MYLHAGNDRQETRNPESLHFLTNAAKTYQADSGGTHKRISNMELHKSD